MTRVSLACLPPDRLAEIWCAMPPRLTPYLAAAHWPVPRQRAAAARWLDESDRGLTLAMLTPEPIGIASLQPDYRDNTRCRQLHMIVESPDSWTRHGADALLQVVELALRCHNANKCEWFVPADRRPQLEAAMALGLRVEVTYPGAFPTWQDSMYATMPKAP
jgi:hypothetical protein